jgi:hypothetical protein
LENHYAQSSIEATRFLIGFRNYQYPHALRFRPILDNAKTPLKARRNHKCTRIEDAGFPVGFKQRDGILTCPLRHQPI